MDRELYEMNMELVKRVRVIGGDLWSNIDFIAKKHDFIATTRGIASSDYRRIVDGVELNIRAVIEQECAGFLPCWWWQIIELRGWSATNSAV